MRDEMKTKTLRTREDLADYFHVSRMQLYRWAKVHPLPTFFTGYGNRNREQDLWTTDDADKWRDEARQKLNKVNPGYLRRM